MIIKAGKCHLLEFCAVVIFCHFLLFEIPVLCVHGTVAAVTCLTYIPYLLKCFLEKLRLLSPPWEQAASDTVLILIR